MPKKEGTLILAIDSQLKNECRKILQNLFDIRELTLFQDLDGNNINIKVLNLV